MILKQLTDSWIFDWDSSITSSPLPPYYTAKKTEAIKEGTDKSELQPQDQNSGLLKLNSMPGPPEPTDLMRHNIFHEAGHWPTATVVGACLRVLATLLLLCPSLPLPPLEGGKSHSAYHHFPGIECLKNDSARLPWRLSGKDPVCQCWGHGFNPWSKKIPRLTDN